MSKVQKRTFSLPAEQAAYIEKKVASGAYASSSEVVREGLRALQERDAVIEKWLLQEVVPALHAYEADPSSAIPLDEAFERAEKAIAERVAQKSARK
jgi:antitoxin ParD1/3/4